MGFDCSRSSIADALFNRLCGSRQHFGGQFDGLRRLFNHWQLLLGFGIEFKGDFLDSLPHEFFCKWDHSGTELRRAMLVLFLRKDLVFLFELLKGDGLKPLQKLHSCHSSNDYRRIYQLINK